MKLTVGDIGMKVADVKRSRSGGDRRRNRHWWIDVFLRKKRKMKMKEKIRENVFVLCERMWCDVREKWKNMIWGRERRWCVCEWVSVGETRHAWPFRYYYPNTTRFCVTYFSRDTFSFSFFYLLTSVFLNFLLN
jgi:hypothetical protein